MAVLGAGAIGGWVGGRLALAGHEVMALASKGPIDTVTIEETGATSQALFRRLDGVVDLLVIAVKATALEAAVSASAPLIGRDTIILPLINGVPWWFSSQPVQCVDPSGVIGASLPAGQMVGSVVHAACHRTAANRIRVVHADRILIGDPNDQPSEQAAKVFALLDDAGLKPEMTRDIRRAVWYKLWGNATINPLSALTRTTADKLLADRDLRQFMLEAMAELAAVGAAIGCPIEESGEDRMAVTARLGAFKPSMLQDVEAGRRIELEALVGAPRELARRHDIATPALDRIYALTRLMGEELQLL